MTEPTEAVRARRGGGHGERHDERDVGLRPSFFGFPFCAGRLG